MATDNYSYSNFAVAVADASGRVDCDLLTQPITGSASVTLSFIQWEQH